MEADDLQALVRQQADLIEKLHEQIAGIQSRLGPVEEPPLAPGAFHEYPRVVYKPGGHAQQVDHPGYEARTVANQDQFDAAMADGWLLLPVDNGSKRKRQ